jgi:hypothetical protein
MNQEQELMAYARQLAKRDHARRCQRLGFSDEQIASYWEACNQDALTKRDSKHGVF